MEKDKHKSGGKSIPKAQISFSKKFLSSYHQKQIPLLKKGDKVEIIIKHILTKKKYHSRGHKVRLKDGTIGRIVKKLK